MRKMVFRKLIRARGRSETGTAAAERVEMIRNIVYDVGYVLVSYTWREKFRSMGYDDDGIARLASGLFGGRKEGDIKSFWEKYDMNEVTDTEIKDFCLEHFPEDREAVEWFFEDPGVWCRYLDDLADTIEPMKKKGYGVYLLSNYPKRLWDLHIGRAPFKGIMDGMVVSCDEGFGKPDEKFYQVLLDRYGLKAEECLFLDDRKDNTEAADRLGFHTITLSSPDKRQEAVSYLESLPEIS